MQRRTSEDLPPSTPWLGPLAAAALAAAETADGVTERRGAVYSSVAGFRPLELDLYSPAGSRRPLPCIVWIHGGAFMMGSKRLLPDFLRERDFFRALAREGFVVASIDYRLSAEARWPAPLLDVRAAIRWLRARSQELWIDSDAIATWGESAGGHLAVCAGVRGALAVPDEDPTLALPRVAAVVDWYGPTDFAAMDAQAPDDSAMSHDAADSPESLLVGAPVQEAAAVVRDADPATHAHADAPPVLIRHGRRDRLVPFGQSEHLARALDAAGVDVRFRPVDGAGHVFEHHPDPGVFVDEAIAFLREVLPASAAPTVPLATPATPIERAAHE